MLDNVDKALQIIQGDVMLARNQLTGAEEAIAGLRAVNASLERALKAPKFKIRDATQYKDRPNLELRGLKRLPFINESRFFPKDADHTLPPNLEWLRTTGLPNIFASLIGTEMVYDVESWHLYDNVTASQAVQNHIALIELIRELNPKLHLGAYGEFVIRNSNRFGDPKEQTTRTKAWQTQNERALSFACRVNRGYPSLYYIGTTGSIMTVHDQYMSGAVLEHKRLLPGVECYPVIWPRYHDTNATPESNRGKYVPYDLWTRTLNVLWDAGADGIVIWDAAKDAPNFPWNAPWWEATENFINLKGITA